jgi:5-methyltetrahydropteroyltriglutamate--homocysteine methyltransferase
MNEQTQQHPHKPHDSFDGGDLDCGNGLLLLIRKHIDPLTPGQLLEILSTESSVVEDLPAWCRLTKNDLVSHIRHGKQNSFLVSKGARDKQQKELAQELSPSELPPASHDTQKKRTKHKKNMRTSRTDREQAPITQPIKEVIIPAELPAPQPAPAIAPLSVMSIGSWPRPPWLLRALNDHLEGRMSDAEFAQTADDAVRLAFAAQQRAGVAVFTDGEQRRDNYASFVGGLLDNCQLIPITDLLPYVDDPEEFERELRALDVPAGKIRHPAVFGPLGRGRSLTVHEGEFLHSLTQAPVKIAIPGPYLLTRTMWMECISDRAYDNREDLATAIVRVLREEIHFLLAAGVSIVQIDEPVLTEVVFSGTTNNRTFMCGALGEKREPAEELTFAESLIQQVIAGLPRERLALHICRGNWTPDESAALAGDYVPLIPLLQNLPVGTFFLEMCTPRAGDMDVLAALPAEARVGVGVVNQKHQRVESIEEVLAKAELAITLFGPERVLLNPDCGFATFADNPIASAELAEQKLSVMVQAATVLRNRYHISI